MANIRFCTGPVLLPDLATWDGRDVLGVFVRPCGLLAPRPGGVYFAVRCKQRPRSGRGSTSPGGRDRLELLDPNNPPPGYPPARAQPLVYNETWDLAAHNAVLRAD